ncbi:hypothetical protein L226DRAFT_93507 [Lentinus tigrinus ALCF2SS1-7]|uniref:uncharacterized protein n=1 Tax=Lentinus tigrinus ALCF2SS1-7 TaxID=1328758 RepID=UPI001166033B|nr:hypothetical protein L226DRAFT_93507 [Lentinus tigrinus ALCF2SS1-7]
MSSDTSHRGIPSSAGASHIGMGRFSGSDVLVLSRTIRRAPCARASMASRTERRVVVQGELYFLLTSYETALYASPRHILPGMGQKLQLIRTSWSSHWQHRGGPDLRKAHPSVTTSHVT